MSRSVDERVVSMQFDNAKFEQNVKTSMSTLDKLKQSLKFEDSAKGLENLEKSANKINFDGLANAAETVVAKFRALDIVAITALQNITNQAIETGKRLVKSLSIDQVTEGWDKYETKTKSVQTIMKATGQSVEDVDKELDRLMWFTDATSYSFGDMVNNIAKFTSQGIDLSTSVTAMEGVATWAAAAGQGTQEAARAMYNISQAMGTGAMTSLDWKSIIYANMATKEFKETAIQTAIDLGVLDESIEIVNGEYIRLAGFEDTLKEKWFTSDVLLETLRRYGEYADKVYEVADGYNTVAEAMKHVDATGMELSKSAFEAGQVAKTWTEVVNATKDAVSSGWMETFELIVGNFTQASKFWTDLQDPFWEIFASGAKGRNSLLKEVLDADSWGTITSKVEDAGVSIEDFQIKLRELGIAEGSLTDQMIEDAGGLVESFQNGWVNGDLLAKTLRSFKDASSSATKSAISDVDKLAYYQEIFDNTWKGVYGNYEARWAKWSEMGLDAAAIQSLINKKGKGYKLTLKDIEKLTANVGEETGEFNTKLEGLARSCEKSYGTLHQLADTLKMPSGRELIQNSIFNTLNALIKVIQTVKNAWQNVFPPKTADQWYGILEAIEKFTEKLIMTDEQAGKLQRAIELVLRPIKTLKSVIEGIVKIAGGLASAILPKVLGVLSTITDAVYGMTTKLDDLVAVIKQKFFDVWDKLYSAVSNNDLFMKASTAIQNGFGTISEGASELLANLDQLDLNSILGKFSSFKSTIFDSVNGILSSKIVSTPMGALTAGIEGVINFFRNLTLPTVNLASVQKFFTDMIQFMDKSNAAAKADTGIKGFTGFFKNKWTLKKNEIKNNFLTAFAEFNLEYGEKIEKAFKIFAKVLDVLKKFVFGEEAATLQKVLELLQKAVLIKVFSQSTNILEAIVLTFSTTSEKLNALLASFTDITKSVSKAVTTTATGFATFVTDLGQAAKKMAKAASWEAFADVLKALSGFIIVVAGAIYLFSQKKITVDTAVAVGIMIAIVTSMIFLVKALSGLSMQADKLQSLNLLPLAATILAFGATVALMAGALKKITKLTYEYSSWDQTMGAFIAIVLGVIGMMAALQHFAPASGAATAVSILAVLTGVDKLLTVLDRFRTYDFSGTQTAIGNMIKMFVVLAIMIRAITRVGSANQVNANAKLLLSVVAAMGAMLVFIKMINKFKVTEIAKGVGTMAVLSTGIVLTMGYLSRIRINGGNNTGYVDFAKNFAKLGATFAVCAAIIYVFGHMDLTTLGVGFLALGALAAGLVAMYKNLAGIEKEPRVLPLMMLALVLAEMVGVMALVKDFTVEEDIPKVLAMSGLIVVLSKLMDTIGKEMKFGGTLIAGMALAELALFLVALSGILIGIRDLNGMNMLAQVGAFSLMIAAFTLVIATISKIKMESTALTSAIGAMAGLAAICVGLAYVFTLVQDLNGIDMIGQAAGLVAGMLALGITVAVVKKVGEVAKGAFKVIASGAVAIVATLGVLIGVFEAFGWLSNALKSKNWDYISEGIELVQTVIEGLTSFLGAAIKGVTSYMPSIGDDLGEFWSRSQGFFEGLGALDPLAAVGALGMVRCIKLLSEQAFVQGLLGIFNLDLSSMGDRLSTFSDALTPFCSKLSLIGRNTQAIEGAKALADICITLTKADFVDTISKWIKPLWDWNDYDWLKEMMTALGEAMAAFGTAIAGVEIGPIRSGVLAAQAMAEVAQTLIEFDLLSMGQNLDMDAFTDYVTGMGKAMYQFAKYCSTTFALIDMSLLSSTTALMDTFVESIDKIAQIFTSGLADPLTGQLDLDLFGTSMQALGKGLSDFVIATYNVNPERATDVAEALGALLGAMEGVEPNVGLFPFLLGTTDFSKFAEQLADLGRGITRFSEETETASLIRVKNAALALQDLVTALNLIKPDGGIVSMWSSTNLGSFATNVGDLGTAMGKFCSGLTQNGFDSAQMVSAAGALKTLIDSVAGLKEYKPGNMNHFTSSMAVLAELAGTEFTARLAQQKDLITKDLENFIVACANTVNNNAWQLYTAFGDALEYSLKSISDENRQESITTEFTELLDFGLAAISEKQDEFVEVGKRCVEGFANGLRDMYSRLNVESASGALAQTTIDKLKEVLGIASPSKVFATLGGYVVQGFVQGLVTNSGSVAATVEQMGGDAVNKFSGIVSTIQSALAGQLNLSPTITPVLDLSEVTAQSKTLNSMFSSNEAMSISSMFADSGLSAESIQNGLGGGVTNIFTQNNYSPKALSRLDIYRQTQNMFSSFERMGKK